MQNDWGMNECSKNVKNAITGQILYSVQLHYFPISDLGIHYRSLF